MRTSYLCLALTLGGCAGNSLIPEPERVQLQDELAAHARYLKVACYLTPFFRDGNKLLLTDQAPDELDLIDRPNGTPIGPGAPLEIVPPGTRLRIEQISFPTSLEVATRVLLTPRYNPWVILKLVDDPKGMTKPYVLVLRPDLRSHDEFIQELERYLGTEDPTAEIKTFSTAVQAAIAQKKVVGGMTPAQVTMAWGHPERVHLDGQTKGQLWTWPLGKQRAWFTGDALVGWEDHGQTSGSPPATP